MMEGNMKILNWVGLFGASLWASIHMMLIPLILSEKATVLLLQILPFFLGFIVSLAVVSAVIFLFGEKKYYLHVGIFYLIMLILIVGYNGATNPAALGTPIDLLTILLDIILLASGFVLWKENKE